MKAMSHAWQFGTYSTYQCLVGYVLIIEIWLLQISEFGFLMLVGVVLRHFRFTREKNGWRGIYCGGQQSGGSAKKRKGNSI